MRDGQDRRFTCQEVVLATCCKKGTVYYRARKLGIKCTKDGYTYEDIKRIMQYNGGRVYTRRPEPRKIELLKKMLGNDGLI